MEVVPADFSEVEISMADPKIIIKGRWAWAAEQLGIQPWGQILIIILLAQAGVLFPWLWIIHGDVREVKGTVQAMPLTITKDLLSQAKEYISLKKINRARDAVDSAEILLARSTAKNVPAKPEDFLEIVADLNVLNTVSDLSQTVTDARVVLANYRSALLPQPPMPGKPGEKEATVEKSFSLTIEAATVDRTTLPASVLIAGNAAPFDFFVTPFIRRLANGPQIISVGFMFGRQTLDGFHWKDVVFVNSLIRYEGGEVELQNTRFVHCTFQMSDTPRSNKVASYIALDQSYLKIGPGE